MQPRSWHVALLCALGALAIAGWRLGAAPLCQTEPHRAVTAHQMIASGDWLVPHLFGTLYLTKPPLQYWLLAGSELLFGSTSEWVWRFPGALAFALLVGALVLVAQRWFSALAGGIAGICALGLIAVWQTFRSAEIDGPHIAATVMASLCLVAMAHRTKSRAWLLCPLAALAIGASLLLKAHAGLPLIIGAIIGPAIALRSWRPLLRGSTWSAVVLGIIPLALWMFALQHQLSSMGITPDLRGIEEAQRNTFGFNFTNARAILSTPIMTLVSCLPMSLVIPFALRRSTLAADNETSHARRRSLAWAVLIALMIGIGAGIHNVRYEYVLMPFVALLAGAVTASILESTATSRWRIALTIAIVALLVAQVVLAMFTWNDVIARASSIAAIAITVGILAWLWRVRRTASNAGCIALLGLAVVLTGIPFGNLDVRRQRSTSSFAAAQQLAKVMAGERAAAVGDVVFNKPDLLWYAGVEVVPSPRYVVQPFAFDAPRWYILEQGEWEHWPAGAKLTHHIAHEIHTHSQTMLLIEARPAAAPTR